MMREQWAEIPSSEGCPQGGVGSESAPSRHPPPDLIPSHDFDRCFMGISEQRKTLANARRIVVKIGSRVLVQKTGRPDVVRMKALVKDIARLRRDGREVVGSVRVSTVHGGRGRPAPPAAPPPAPRRARTG